MAGAKFLDKTDWTDKISEAAELTIRQPTDAVFADIRGDVPRVQGTRGLDIDVATSRSGAGNSDLGLGTHFFS